MRTDRKADSVGVVTGGHGGFFTGKEGGSDISDDTSARSDAMAFFHYDKAHTKPVTVWVGLSYVSLEQARANLDAEQMPFQPGAGRGRDGPAGEACSHRS